MKPSRSLMTLTLLGASSMAYAAGNCSVKLSGDDVMKFDSKEVSVSASCPSITVELVHAGKLPVTAMGHNVVITKTADVVGVAKDGIKAGAANAYVPAGDARVIASTKLVGGGESTKITFPGKALSAGGDYTFFCSFPGHSTLMKGKLVVR